MIKAQEITEQEISVLNNTSAKQTPSQGSRIMQKREWRDEPEVVDDQKTFSRNIRVDALEFMCPRPV